jgi:ankyrin repeat protein
MPCDGSDCYLPYYASDSDDEGLEAPNPTAVSSVPMSFDLLTLPNELVIDVARQLPKTDLTALMWTSKHVRSLLAPLRYKDKYSELIIAVRMRQPMAIKLLMDRMGVDIHAIPDSVHNSDIDGNLLIAAITGSNCRSRMKCSLSLVKTLKLLIANGVNVNAKDYEGMAPIHHAAHCPRMREVVSLLLDSGADGKAQDFAGRTAMHYAAQFNHVNILSELLSRRIDTLKTWDRQGDAPVHLAMSAMVDSTLVCGLTDEYSDELVVKMASLGMLARAGAANARAEEDGKAPLHRVMDPKGMYHYCHGGHVIARAMMRILLENGADPNARDRDGKAVIHIAVEKRNSDLLNALKNKAALIGKPLDLNACVQNQLGDSPFHHGIRTIPCGCNDDELDVCVRGFVLNGLIDLGAKIDLQNNIGETPLHLVLGKEYYCSRAATSLVDAGARVDIPDALGETPVHIAAEMLRDDHLRMMLRNVDMVKGKGKELLEMRDSKGRTPAECSKGKGKKKVDGILHHWYQKWVNEEGTTSDH